jgi:hypothetical protein
MQTSFPSRFDINDDVIAGGSLATVTGVSFSEGKVRYDVAFYSGGRSTVDSEFVQPAVGASGAVNLNDIIFATDPVFGPSGPVELTPGTAEGITDDEPCSCIVCRENAEDDGNKFGVQPEKWAIWSFDAQKVFNRVYEDMLEAPGDFFHPEAEVPPTALFITTAHNAAWVAADAVDDL